MAHSPTVSRVASGWLWHAAYRRAVSAAFRTVPLYRERWALDGRTDPVLVPGRTGVDGGAVPAAEAQRRLGDLVPLAGGSREVDPLRGLGPVVAMDRLVGRGDLVVVLDDERPGQLAGLPVGVRGRVCRVDGLGSVAGTEWWAAVVVGSAEQLGRMPDETRARLRIVPRLELADLTDADGERGLLHDHQLGFLGALRRCGGWHLDWPRVYARETDAGLAMTLLRQRSPCFVDVLVGGGVKGVVATCPMHGTPVVRT